jgi:hypothetical protein
MGAMEKRDILLILLRPFHKVQFILWITETLYGKGKFENEEYRKGCLRAI